jgi:hypothetical protein
VTIERLIYDPVAQTLLVATTSTGKPDVTLSADGYGTIPWRAAGNEYRKVFGGVAQLPLSVTVTSNLGGAGTQIP